MSLCVVVFIPKIIFKWTNEIKKGEKILSNSIIVIVFQNIYNVISNQKFSIFHFFIHLFFISLFSEKMNILAIDFFKHFGRTH